MNKFEILYNFVIKAFTHNLFLSVWLLAKVKRFKFKFYEYYILVKKYILKNILFV